MSGATKQLEIESASVEETLALGKRLGSLTEGGLTIGLVGILGAGKTYFVKGIAAGNAPEVPTDVTSPTFTLVHQYPGRLRLFHVDAYRLAGVSDLARLGFDEFISEDSLVVVEWADRVRPLMPDDTLWIELEAIGETKRRLTFRTSGQRAVACLTALQNGADGRHDV